MRSEGSGDESGDGETERAPPAEPRLPLNELLFGRPLAEREPWQNLSDSATLNAMIDELVSFLGEEHSRTSRAFVQAERELFLVRDLPIDCPIALTCKRAMVLFALWREPKYGKRFHGTDDDALVRDLCDRVLPILGPPFLKGIGQRPDSFVNGCAAMHTLWDDSPFEDPVVSYSGGGAGAGARGVR